MKIRGTFSGKKWRLQRQRSTVSRNRKFLGKWNSFLVLSRAHFYTSTWFTLLSRNLAAKSLDNGPKDQVSQHLTGSAFSCTLALLSLGMVISYILLLRSRSQFPPVSIFSSQLFRAFLRSVCIRPSLFFRFTRTHWCPSFAYSLSLVFSPIHLNSCKPFSFYLFLLPSSLLLSLSLSFVYAFMPIWLVLLGRFHRDLSPCTCCWLVSMTGGGLSF